jgi:hypothetical protein
MLPMETPYYIKENNKKIYKNMFILSKRRRRLPPAKKGIGFRRFILKATPKDLCCLLVFLMLQYHQENPRGLFNGKESRQIFTK